MDINIIFLNFEDKEAIEIKQKKMFEKCAKEKQYKKEEISK